MTVRISQYDRVDFGNTTVRFPQYDRAVSQYDRAVSQYDRAVSQYERQRSGTFRMASVAEAGAGHLHPSHLSHVWRDAVR